jgi:signal transduction histidine kinase
MIYSDKKLLKNIIINLVTNAIKFSKETSPVSIQTRVADGRAVISVIDEGIGIGKEDQDHLFSSFFRGANAANIAGTAGTGLGLHIVKRYTDLLKGNVQLQSELNKGTTVTVDIPVRPDEADET